MKQPTYEAILPISWEGWDSGTGCNSMQYINVTFTEKFGPFEKGEKHDVVVVDFEGGDIQCFDAEGNVYKQMMFKLCETEKHFNEGML